MNGFGVALVVIGALLLGALIFVGATFIIMWNVNDMINEGVNFWNVFWTLLALSTVLGGTTKAAS